MAIAPLPDVEVDEIPWPRPTLRLVEPLVDEGRVGTDLIEFAPADVDRSLLEFVWDAGDAPDTESGEALWVSVAPDAPARRRPGVSSRVRRRQLALGALVAGVLVALALPLSPLGGRPVPASPAAASPAAAGGTVYVVQPGDTLWSIASQVEGSGNPRPLVEALEARLGSSTVVPGEHITIP